MSHFKAYGLILSICVSNVFWFILMQEKYQVIFLYIQLNSME